MDTSRDSHAEWTQIEKDKYYDISYMWNLKKWYKWTYLQNRNRVTDVENKFMVNWGGKNKEEG